MSPISTAVLNTQTLNKGYLFIYFPPEKVLLLRGNAPGQGSVWEDQCRWNSADMLLPVTTCLNDQGWESSGGTHFPGIIS